MKIFTKKIYFLSAIVGVLTLVSVVTIRCKKPTDGIVVTVNTSDLFHYTALVQIVDASGAVPNNLSVEVTGTNAAAIYGIDGKKALSAPGGIIALAVHPKMEPAANAPLQFNLSITGPGYLPLIVPVTISTDQKSQIIKASILNLTKPTAGVSSASKTATASGGTVTSTTTLSTPASSGPEATTITIPAGTKLQDVNGNTINASSVSVSANNFNTSQQNAIDLFPGGSLVATNISGGTQTSGLMAPAGFVNVNMTAGGTEVKKFSSPINLSMTLDPGYKDPSTGAPLAVGSVLGIYSYDTSTGQWQFEQNATVTTSGGNLVVNFTTSHLTTYTAAKLQTVLTLTKISILASWFKAGISTPIVITAAIQNGPSYKIYSQTWDLRDIITTGILIPNAIPVPTSTNPVLFTISTVSGTVLGNGTLTAGTSTFTVTLTAPPTNPEATLSLKLDCTQAKQKTIVTPPDFYLLYKTTGQPASSYVVLGQVKGGLITTTQLSASVTYDFKAVLNSNVKEVKSHTIAENVPDNQTVGGNSFNGTKYPAQNQIDINALCNSLP